MKQLLLVFSLLFSFRNYSQEIDYNKLAQVQTKATYSTEVEPDKITLSIELAESNTKGKVSVEELEGRLESVLKANNVNISKQLTLKDLSSNFHSYFLKKTDVQKSKRFNLDVSSAIEAGNILRDLADAEISNVRLLKTEYTKLEDLKIELKGKAVAKAKVQAEEMLSAINQKVGEAIFVSDVESNVSVVNALSGRVPGLNISGAKSVIGSDNESNLDISFENIRVEATVMVNFRIDK